MPELLAIEAAFPPLVTLDSPTQRVGAAPAGAFGKVVHQRPMLSLGNVFDEEGLRTFDTRVRRGLGLAPAPESARNGSTQKIAAVRRAAAVAYLNRSRRISRTNTSTSRVFARCSRRLV